MPDQPSLPSPVPLPAVAPSDPYAVAPHNGHAVAPHNGDGRGVSTAGEEGIDWRRYLAAARRYKWLIVGLALLGAAGGVLATRLRPAQFMAQATIWIQASETPRGNAIRGPFGNEQLMPAAGAIHLAKSFMVLDAVVRDRRMYIGAAPADRAVVESLSVRDPLRGGLYRLRVDSAGRYELLGAEGEPLERGTVGDSIGRPYGMLWQPSAAVLRPGTDVAFSLNSVRGAAQGLASALVVGLDPSGSFLRISLTSQDGAGAAAIVNAIAERYIAVSTELKRAKLTELARLLDDQLASSKENLRRAEDALARFRTRTITLPSDGGVAAAVPMQSSGYVQLRAEEDQLRRDREGITRVLGQSGDSGASIEALAFIGAVQKSPDLAQALQELATKRAELRALRYRYTDEHPSVRQLAEDVALLEGRTIPGLARTLVEQLAAREGALQPEITAGGRELQAVPQRAVEEARLRRDADLAAGMYTAVQGRQAEARLAEASSVADVRLLDAAVAPRSPVKKLDPRFIVMGLLFGLGAGVVGSVVADRLDPRVRYANQVTRDWGLRILGMLPHVKNRKAGPDDPQVAQLIEAMRSVRLNLAHAYGTATPLVITVTSPGVGDGKSFVSTNLALACAQAGQRTLLIDGDSRRGALHRNLDASRTPGLTDFLGGRAGFEEIIQRTPYPQLQFIGAGKRLRESPELLGTPAMVALLGRVRPLFDAIIVDSPPLGAGVDPCMLGTLTGSMVLVLRSGATHRDVTRTHLAMVSQLPIRLLGVVLNDVGAAGMYAYYGYYYLAGYGVDDEPAERTTPAIGSGTPEVREWEPTRQ